LHLQGPTVGKGKRVVVEEVVAGPIEAQYTVYQLETFDYYCLGIFYARLDQTNLRIGTRGEGRMIGWFGW